MKPVIGPFGQPYLQAKLVDELLVLVVVLRQPAEVLLAALHHAVGVQMRSAAAQRLELRSRADFGDARDLVIVHLLQSRARAVR